MTDLEMDLVIANAEIKRLKALIPEWISANERLPDETYKVLVYNAKNGSYGVARYSAQWGKWRSSGNTSVTHWMPLPQPPNEGEEHG